jgi:hypothetical protein
VRIAALATSAILALATLTPLAGCSSEREIVVTRDTYAGRWPLRINSAVVVCSGGEGALLKLGAKRYALDEAALARGFDDARGIDAARGDEVMELGAVCTAVAAAE